MAVLIHPGAIPAPFSSSKKGSFNFASQRKAVDYYATAVKTLENRLWQRDQRDRPFIQPDLTYYNELSLPCGLHESPVYSVTTKFVRAAANKSRCPIYCISWVPDGRRLITGAATGEFTLWNGINFNFESILQGHDCSVRSMTWSHNGVWMTSTDDRGFVKYWQANLNNVHTFQAHNDPVRSSSFSPTDTKLATCSEDGTIRTFDFVRCAEEFILRGHGADVMSVDWHPRKSLLASGSKDTQQPVKLWDPKAGQSIATIHAHKASVQSVSWNRNGNWLLTAAWDALIKVFDIRNMKELHTLKGHKKDVNTVAWHPVHESLFASGGGDGSILFWTIGNEREIGGMESAHDSFIWNLSWHPLGHVLVSCSSDHTSKFWCRNRPGEEMRDRYNTASALISEEAVEENYSFPMLGIGGGAANQHQAITLPPPSWSSQHQSGQGVGAKDESSEQSSQEKGATPLNVPVLGADIIAEQFRDKPKPPAASVAPDNQTTPTTHPPDGPFNFPPRRPFDEQGRPPPENMNFHRPDQERGGMPLQGPPPPAPPEHFRHPPPDQREWHSRGPPPGREFVRPEFRGPPPPGEFNRPSPYSWQRSAANFRERRPSYEEHRFPPPEHANPYVYRRPEPEPQRDPRDQHRPDWREGPHPPRRQPPWEEGRGPPPQQLPPMREEFPGRGGPGGPGGMLGARRPPEDFDRHEEFRHERHGGGGAYPPHSGPPGGPQGQEHPPQRQPQPAQGPQQPQQREMWERGPPPPQQQPPSQGQLFPEPRRQPSTPLDPRAQGRHPPQEHQQGGAPPTSSAPPSDPQRTGFPHAPPDKQQQPPYQRGGPPRSDQPRVPPHGMPHPPRSEAQGPLPPQRFIERPAPGSDIQRSHPPPTSEAQRLHLPPTSEAHRPHPPPSSEAQRTRPPPTSEAQQQQQQQRPPGPHQQHPAMSPHQAPPPSLGPGDKFFQQPGPPHTPPGQGQPRFPGPPHQGPAGVRPPVQKFGGPEMRMGPRGPPPPNQPQQFPRPPPSSEQQGRPPLHNRPAPLPSRERQPPSEQAHPPHDRQGPPPPHERQGHPPSHERQGHHPPHDRQGPPPSHGRQGHPPPHEQQGHPPPPGQGHPPPHNRQGHPPPVERQGHPPPHDRQGHPPPVERQGHPPPNDRQGHPPPVERQGHPPPHDRQGHPPPHDRQGHPPPHDRQGHPPPHERQVPTPPQRFQPPPRQQQPPQQQFRGGAPPTVGPGQQPQVQRRPAPNPADPRMNRPGPSPDQPPPSQHPLHLPPPGGRGGQQFGGPPRSEGYHPPGKPYDGRGQGPPPGHMQQAPPPSHVQQAPPSGHMQQGPPPGHMQQAPPPGHMQQAPPPGHMQQMPQGGNSPHWSGPRGGPPPPQFREDPSSQGGYEHSRDPRDRRREPHPLNKERHDRSSPHRRGSDDREVPASKRSRVEKDQDGHTRQR